MSSVQYSAVLSLCPTRICPRRSSPPHPHRGPGRPITVNIRGDRSATMSAIAAIAAIARVIEEDSIRNRGICDNQVVISGWWPPIPELMYTEAAVIKYTIIHVSREGALDVFISSNAHRWRQFCYAYGQVFLESILFIICYAGYSTVYNGLK